MGQSKAEGCLARYALQGGKKAVRREKNSRPDTANQKIIESVIG